MFQGQIGEIPFLSQGKLGFVSHFSPIFPPAPLKNWALQITFSNTYITGLS